MVVENMKTRTQHLYDQMSKSQKAWLRHLAIVKQVCQKIWNLEDDVPFKFECAERAELYIFVEFHTLEHAMGYTHRVEGIYESYIPFSIIDTQDPNKIEQAVVKNQIKQ